VNDTKLLESQLGRLQRIFEDATRSRQKSSISGMRRMSTPSGDAALLQERVAQSGQLIGDFRRTLNDCNAFLAKNAAYGGGNRVISAAKWYSMGLETQSQQLRTRIQFHCTKIEFLLEPLHLELLDHISQNVETILRYSRRIYDVLSERGPGGYDLPAVPARLAARYEMQAQQPNQRPFQNSDPYPVEESVDALLFHYSRSEIDNPHAQVSSSKQLNGLLKTQWILEKVIRHPQFKRVGPLLRSIVARVDERIRIQYEVIRPDWIEEHVQIIMTMDQTCFRIWFQADLPIPPPPAHVAGIDEEKILEVELQDVGETRDKELCLFRRSDTEFRLVETAATESGTRQVINRKVFNTQHWRSTPWYAAPNRPESSRSFQLCDNRVNVDHGDLFTLKREDDVFAFQQALTNYRVVYNSAQVHWSLQRPKKLVYSKVITGSEPWSGLQIWEYAPLQDMDDTPSDPSDSRASSRSPSTKIAASLLSAVPRRAGSMMTVVQDASGTEATASTSPKHPALVIFTMLEGRPAYLYIPLNGRLKCNLRRCRCVNPRSDCQVAVLENGANRRKGFGLSVHHAADWADWNLLLLAEPKPPPFHKISHWADATELCLTFATATARKSFQLALCEALERHHKPAWPGSPGISPAETRLGTSFGSDDSSGRISVSSSLLAPSADLSRTSTAVTSDLPATRMSLLSRTSRDDSILESPRAVSPYYELAVPAYAAHPVSAGAKLPVATCAEMPVTGYEGYLRPEPIELAGDEPTFDRAVVTYAEMPVTGYAGYLGPEPIELAGDEPTFDRAVASGRPGALAARLNSSQNLYFEAPPPWSP
jgi:hypothetical protein